MLKESFSLAAGISEKKIFISLSYFALASLSKTSFCQFAVWSQTDRRCILFIPFYETSTVKAELQGKAQAEVVVPVVRSVVVPVRNTTVPRIVVPAATTVHAISALTDTFQMYFAFAFSSSLPLLSLRKPLDMLHV